VHYPHTHWHRTAFPTVHYKAAEPFITAYELLNYERVNTLRSNTLWTMWKLHTIFQ